MYDLVGFSYNLLVLQALCIIVIILNCLAWAFPAKPAPSLTTLPADRYMVLIGLGKMEGENVA
jgi:hypothetical protein